MSKEPILMILSELEETKNSCGFEIVELEIDILGKAVYFRIGIADNQARLSDIVPLARTISTKQALTVLDSLSMNGQSVPCCKGCSACCNYLIPLSVPEVFCLREELLAMSADYSNRILQSCLDTAKRLLDNKPPIFSSKTSSKSARSRIGRIGKWYAGLKLACPFLSDRLCILYEQRPIACREHIVTGSSVSCKIGQRGEPNVVPIPVSILEAVCQLTAELENLDKEAIMMPLAFAWAGDNLPRADRTWPAVAMVTRFVEILKEMAVKNSAMAVVTK